METKWEIKEGGGSVFTGLSHITSKLLHNRGFKDEKSVQKFINPSLLDLHNPIKMKGMDKLVQRVHNAMRESKKIVVFGDYD